ncbi:DUF465 domain-containing protein [Acinetobacter sp. B51(2017)]|uniref:YdcH family protein n=1 Tax=Acinetobacter sp. B51(2017) TaxID=2060938 RepID=UPI000F08222E|nr:DUF465 domain-containing protein [Acinetobacter sp. B51(2017)]
MKTKESNKKTKFMFPEFKDLIPKLREDNPHFAKMFEQHEQLDREINLLEQDPVNQIRDDIELLKRQKLKLKDQMYLMLQQAQTQ